MWGLTDDRPFIEVENAKRKQVGEKGVELSFGQIESEVPVQLPGMMSSRYWIHGSELLLFPFL